MQAVSLNLAAQTFADNPVYQDCVSCHKNEYQYWQQSDHAKSMAKADKSSILADFNDVSVSHYGQKALFHQDKTRFLVTISYGQKTETFQIKYAFGFYPLQQYLVETAAGKLQVLPFSWDSRTLSEGGQRWYHNYSSEEIRPAGRLHWRQPLQNWNGMCADCHSDGLIRNYNVKKNIFNTQFDNINVGCYSCHGDMNEHSTLQQSIATKDKVVSPAKDRNEKQWIRKSGEKTAKWQGSPRDNRFMDICFACHSLRSPLTDGIKPDVHYLDQFTPQVLMPPLYHADGQISEEVYVYGSFLQSKMYASGVNCTDCHDQHSMKLKVQGNGICLQCHGAEVYNVKQHHHHPQDSIGAQCTSCHMPDNRYMGVDDRRDHSFKIPHPDVSQQYGTPDLCTECHKGRTTSWSEKQLRDWFGKTQDISTTQNNYYRIQTGGAIEPGDHLLIIADEDLSVITRATALQLINRSTNSIQGSVLNTYFTHSEALLRLSAASVANLIPENERARFLVPLLKDKYRAVRVAAARNLISVPLSDKQQVIYDEIYQELLLAMDVNSWRGEGRANRALMELDSGNWESAEKAFQSAINIDPYFESGYLNLAELYRQQSKLKLEKQTLDKAIKLFPDSADLQYSFGLYLVRQKHYHRASFYFEKAVILAPVIEQYAYTYILSLDGEGKTLEAMTKLKEIIHRYGEAQQLKELGQYLYSKLNTP